MHNPEAAGAFESIPVLSDAEGGQEDGAQVNENQNLTDDPHENELARKERYGFPQDREINVAESADGILIRTTATNNPGDIEEVRQKLKDLLEGTK